MPPQYVSRLRNNEIVIDASNINHFVTVTAGMPKGYIPRDMQRDPFGVGAGASVFNLPIIPRKDWPDLIRERESKKQNLSDVALAQGIKSKNQQQTNYCWTNAVVTAMETRRAAMGQSYVKLSPASVAAPIRGYQNQGGWGSEALAYITTHGIAPESLWPANAIDSRYAAPSAQERLKYKITKWLDMESKNFEQLATCLLSDIPVPAGRLRWSHETCSMDLVALANGQFGVRDRNSWDDSWSDGDGHGFFVMSEALALADDQVGVVDVTLVGD